MQTHQLICHPATPSSAHFEMSATIERVCEDMYSLEYQVSGDLRAIYFPPVCIGKPERKDNLWMTTCFEVFIKPNSGQRYTEINYAPPSMNWAAYAFTAYRERGPDPDSLEPGGAFLMNKGSAVFAVPLSLSEDDLPCHLALAAVIEETDGTKSYWALAHPNPDKPDFHHPDSFVLTLPP